MSAKEPETNLTEQVVLLVGSGMTPRTVASQLGVTPLEVRRLWKMAIEEYGMAVGVADALHVILAQLSDVQEQQALIAATATGSGQYRLALTALRDRAGTLRTQASILKPPEGTNVFVSAGGSEDGIVLKEWIAQTTSRRAAAVDVLEADS